MIQFTTFFQGNNMLKTILKSTIALTLVAGMSGCAISNSTVSKTQERVGAVLHGVAGDQDKNFMKVVDSLESIDFVLSDPHPHVNNAYVEQFGSTKLDNLGFFSIANNTKLRNLLEKYPQIGGFSPFNLHVYKKKTENMTWVGHLNPEVMMDIVGVTDTDARAEFASMFKPLDESIQKNMNPTTQKKIMFTALPAEPMITFEFDVDGSTEDFAEDFQEKFEGAFEDKKYIIAGYKNIKEAYDDMDEDFSYDAYWVYSLCHMKFSNAIFNDLPEAGLFAPCSVYMYIKDEKMYVGMPRLQNWANVISITNPEKLKYVKDIDAEIIATFIELGGKQVKAMK